VEGGVAAGVLDAQHSLTFVLNEPDYTTAQRIAQAINAQWGKSLAVARDASGIDIEVPSEFGDRTAAFMTRIETLSVQPDRRAKVVVNERTGVVVSGGDVRISKVVISHGDIRISIATQNTASQPYGVWRPGPGVRTAIVSNTQVEVEESVGGQAGFVAASSTVSELVQSLARLRTPTRDVISILRAVKAAGALHAELIVQ
jgi:flagellar P-ring protein precursor FlgI